MTNQMIIKCKPCGKNYRINSNKFTSNQMLLICPHCKSETIVAKPREEIESNEAFDLSNSDRPSGPHPNLKPDKKRSSKLPRFKLEMGNQTLLNSIKKNKTNLTVGKKLLLVFLIFIFFTGSILTVVYMMLVPSLMHNQLNLRTSSISHSLSAAVQEPLLTKNYVVVNQTAEINAKLPGVAYVYVLDKKHNVVAGMFGDKKRFRPDFIDKANEFGFPKEISSLNKIPSDKAESSLDYQVGGQKIHDVAVRIGHGSETAHVGLFTENAENTVRKSLIPLLIVLIVFTLLGCLSFLLVARTISTPIQSLTQAAERLSLGEIDSPIQVRGSGEIRDLAASLERMRFSIKEAINRLKRISTVDEQIAKTGT
jgi:predicted Zn finger-like uncharacterized protein